MEGQELKASWYVGRPLSLFEISERSRRTMTKKQSMTKQQQQQQKLHHRKSNVYLSQENGKNVTRAVPEPDPPPYRLAS